MLIKRSDENPILKPEKYHSWEATAVFNGCPTEKDGQDYFVYRALSLPHYHTVAQKKLQVSSIGVAKTDSGVDFYDRERFIIPEESWEAFGCEDPRVTEIDGKYYIFYTALSTYPFKAEGIKVGLAISEDLETIDEKHLITPFNAKAMSLFPEKINGKFWSVLSVNTDNPPAKIALASFDKEEEIWDRDRWRDWYKDLDNHCLDLARRPEDQVEVGAPPIKTEEGWILLYSYIRNYRSNDPLFTVEAALLDLDSPSKIIARTKNPLLTPEEYYEKIGLVSDVVFPSGAKLEGGKIKLYYGAADTTCCLAEIDKDHLIEKMTRKRNPAELKRASTNPILEPIPENSWESKAVFNPAAIHLDGEVHILYRAMGEDNTSTIGYARSADGVNIDYRHPEPVYEPRRPFEEKLTPGGNSGCEDPRITKIDNRIYMTYTAFDGRNPPRVALASISVDDFLDENWNWKEPVLISPPNIDDKDACIFPEKVNGKYFIVHRGGDDIDTSFNKSLDFDGETWIEEYRWIYPRRGMWDSEKVGVAGPPIKTEEGWVLFYHGVSKDDGKYRVGVVLLSLDDPTKITARLDDYIFEPETEYEKIGIVSNVVFPCGNVLMDDTFYIYYGGADKVTGVATIKKQELLETLKMNQY